MNNVNNEKVWTEADWKLFRKKIINWQENYMNKLNEEYIEILNQEKSPSVKFWELHNRIKDDRNKIGVVIDMRRSMLISNMHELLNDEVITMKDLDDFSDGLKEEMQWFMDYRNSRKTK